MLTPQQNTIVAAYVAATPELSSLQPSADNAFAIANAMNAIASPAFIVWKTNVDPDEIMKNGMDWTRVDNLSVGKARIWDWLTRLGTMNASKPNVRAGIDATWVGTAADLAVRASVYVHCKRSATVIEKLLATGTGSDATPATMGYEGSVNYLDMMNAMGW
jgi:hypothetical protein